MPLKFIALIFLTSCLCNLLIGDDTEVKEAYIDNWYKNKVYGDYSTPIILEERYFKLLTHKIDNSLIQNPGFEGTSPEEGLENWTTSPDLTVNFVEAFSGNKSVTLTNDQFVRTNEITIQPGKFYSLSYWIKLYPKMEFSYDSAFAEIFFLDQERKYIRHLSIPNKGQLRINPSTANGTGWIPIEEVFVTPDNAAFATLTFTSEGQLEVSLDHIVFQEYSHLSIKGSGSLSNPLSISKAELPRLKTLEIELIGFDGSSFIHDDLIIELQDGERLKASSTSFNSESNILHVELEIPDLQLGKHRFCISISNHEQFVRGFGQFAVNQEDNIFLLAVITDQHYYNHFTDWHRRYRDNMDTIIKMVNVHNPDLTVFLGDYDEDFQPPYNIYKDIDTLDSPVIIGRGNHEYDGGNEYKYNYYFSQKATDYYFSKDWGNYHLLMIAGNELSLHGGHNETLLSEEQFLWIEKELIAHRDKTTVVLTEPSVFFKDGPGSFTTSNPNHSTRLRQLFSDNNVKLVVQGDKHQYYKGTENGVTYLTIPSPTRPFLRDPFAGYGLVLLKDDEMLFADAIEVFHQNPNDPHSPAAWSLRVENGQAIPTGHLPTNFYSKQVLSLDQYEGGYSVWFNNDQKMLHRVPFRSRTSFSPLNTISYDSHLNRRYFQTDIASTATQTMLPQNSDHWENWRQVNFGEDILDLSVSGPTATPYANRIANLVNYAFGDSPFADEFAVPDPRTILENGEIGIEFLRPREVSSKVEYILQFSTDLISWDPYLLSEFDNISSEPFAYHERVRISDILNDPILKSNYDFVRIGARLEE